MKKRKCNIMQEFTIEEIASVDKPAQGPGARVVLMKSRESLEKRSILTDSIDGHSHLLRIDDGNGRLSSGETSWVEGHSHPWILTPEGDVFVGESNRHTHRPLAISKAKDKEQRSASSDPITKADNPETNMENDNPVISAEQFAEMEARLTKAEILATLTDSEKVYLSGLTKSAAKKFLASDERDEIMQKSADSDPVVATTESGREIRKSQDPTGMLAELVLEKAKDKKKIKDLDDDNKKKDLEKRAGELKTLPGTTGTKVAMLKALDSIEDEAVRKSALESLNANAAAKSADFDEVGETDASVEVSEGLDRLDELAKSIQEKTPGLSYEKAYVQAMTTPEGSLAYTKSQEG